MIIQEAAEMYLETILLLSRSGSRVRAVDVATEMGYSKPTISEQMKKFRDNGYVELDSDGSILLTEAGRSIAERTYERHTLIASMLRELGVKDEIASQDACRVEHYISQQTFDCLKAHYLQQHPELAAGEAHE